MECSGSVSIAGGLPREDPPVIITKHVLSNSGEAEILLIDNTPEHLWNITSGFTLYRELENWIFGSMNPGAD